MTSAVGEGCGDGMRFSLVAVPLSRPDVSGFIRDWHVPARGAVVGVIEQRPSPALRDRWLTQLTELSDDPAEAATQVLTIDDAMCHVGTRATDRLVPREFLDDDRFLERNLGGWAPVWFDAIGVRDDSPDDDPVLAACERLVTYGSRIASATAPPAVVADRLEHEFGGSLGAARRGAQVLRDIRSAAADDDPVDLLVAAALGDQTSLGAVDRGLLYDELIEQLIRLELRRRAAVADDHLSAARNHHDRQRRYARELGIELLLKGEYIMGRHRRSTILLAERFGIVVKQPAPEPEHDVDLEARTHEGTAEHWPRATGDGRMVTARADIAQVVDSTAVERVNTAFGRDVWFSTALGLSVEPFESGPTLAALARQRPEALSAERYDEILVHQLVCEHLGVDNPDWHAANFMVTDDGLVHVDWGAARPIDPADATPEGARRRLDHVVELAWSFHDQQLAGRTQALHARAVSDPEHVAQLRARARARVE